MRSPIRRRPIAVVFEGRNGLWYFRITSANHRTIAASEGYTRRWSAQRGAYRVIDARRGVR